MADRELVNRLEPVIKQIRDRANSIQRLWLENYSTYRGIRTRAYFNSEHFKHYIPAARKAVRRTKIRMCQMLVPNDDYFETYPGDIFDAASGAASDSVSAYMTYLLEQRIRIKSIVSQLGFNFLLCARAVTKSSVELVHWSEDAEGKIKHADIWPTLRAVDPFSFYWFPEVCTDLDRAQLIFEDSFYPWSDYLDAVEASGGLIDSIDRDAVEKPQPSNYHLERIQLSHGQSPADLSNGDRPKGEAGQVGLFVQLTEAFLKYQQKWMHVWIVWNLKTGPKIVRLHPMVGDRQPFRVAIDGEIPGEASSMSMMDDLVDLQVLLNDQVNLQQEASVIAAVPPVVIDPTRVTRADSLVFRPRQKWLMEPDGAQLLNIPDTSRGSQAGVMATLNLITSVFSPGGIVEGQPPRGSPRAGFAFSSMVNLSMADIKDMADNIEENLLTPALKDLYSLTIRFVPREQVLRIPGTANYAPQNLTVYDLYGGWNFRWVGQLQGQDLQMRGQKIKEFLEGMAPLLEPLMMQGHTVDLAMMLKMVWRMAVQERGIDKLIVPLPPQPPQGPPGMIPPGGAPPPGVNPLQAMAGMLGAGGGPSAATPENQQRQSSRQRSSTSGGPSQ
jgi:hypothetical protein